MQYLLHFKFHHFVKRLALQSSGILHNSVRTFLSEIWGFMTQRNIFTLPIQFNFTTLFKQLNTDTDSKLNY